MSAVQDVINAGKKQCPKCDSYEMFEKVPKRMWICLTCFGSVKTAAVPRVEPTSKKSDMYIALACFGFVALSGIALATLIRHQERPQYQQTQYETPSDVRSSSAGAISGSESDPQKVFGDKPWVKGFMDKPDSCYTLASGTTPKQDADADGSGAYMVRGTSDEKEYSLFYTDGFRTWVYSSSEAECRREVTSWINKHTLGAGD